MLRCRITRRALAILAIFHSPFMQAAETHTVTSPDKNIRVTLSMHEGVPTWSVKMGEHAVLKPSRLGLAIEGKEESLRSLSFTARSADSTWKPVWGKASSIRDHYNEVTWKIGGADGEVRWGVITRSYNGGVAIRYTYPGKGELVFTGDRTEMNFAGDFACWAANGERANIGPVPLSKYKGSFLPVTVRLADDCYTAVLEADLSGHAPFSLKHSGPTSFNLSMGRSRVALPAQSSWRVLLLGSTPGALLVNHTIVNLNPPCAIEDSSWIRPGLALWDWRAWGAVADDGFTYGLDMESWKRMIEFASKHGLGYLLLDAGWYGLEFDPKEDPTTSRDHLIIQPHPNKPHLVRESAPKDWAHPIDVPAIIRYGKEKKVGVILYLNDAAQKQHDLENTLATYQEWGAAGIKYGFMKAGGQGKVAKTRRIVELCAKHQLLCDFHDSPILPTGERRTYPNYITREYCHSQSDAMRTFTPRTFCTTVFVNMLSGPVDMCNGLYAINDAKAKRPKIFSELYSTVTAETARTLITYSGMHILPDIPDAYEAKSDLFEFIARLPMNWDETRILHGEIGRHISTARRSGKQWFIGSCCDENGGELAIKLDFLEPGISYATTLYEDGGDAHYKTQRESYRVRKMTVKKGDVIPARMAPGGGHCIFLTP